MKTKYILFMICSLVLFGCGKQQIKEKNFTLGNAENGVYSNTFFDFTMNYDQNWKIQSNEQQEKNKERGEELLSKEQQEYFDSQQGQKPATLFTIYQYPVGENVDYNPSIIIMSENVVGKGLRNSMDYLGQVSKGIKESGINHNIEPGYVSKEMGGMDFNLLRLKLMLPNFEIKQEYFSALIDGYVLTATLSFTTDEQHKKLLDMWNSIKFG